MDIRLIGLGLCASSLPLLFTGLSIGLAGGPTILVQLAVIWSILFVFSGGAVAVMGPIPEEATS